MDEKKEIKLGNLTVTLYPWMYFLFFVLLVLAGSFFLMKNFERPEEQPVPSASASVSPQETTAPEEVFDGTTLITTADAGREYIEQSLFLGDSNTARFLRFVDESGMTFTDTGNTIGVVGMGVDAISTLPCLDTSLGRLTMPQAAGALAPARIMVMFGTNNLSGTDTDSSSFIERYSLQLELIEQASPQSDLIILSIPPIAENSSYRMVSMEQIDAYNEGIRKMCEDKGWLYLNTAEALKDEQSGYARTGYMDSDGLHLSRSGLSSLFHYIRTHAWNEENKEELSSSVLVYGVPDGLIQINPLTNEEFASETPVCGENAWTDGTGCYCNDGYTGDAAAGCTAVPVQTEDPLEKEKQACLAYGAGYAWNGEVCVCAEGYDYDGNGGCVIHQETVVPSASPEPEPASSDKPEETKTPEPSTSPEASAQPAEPSAEPEVTEAPVQSEEPAGQSPEPETETGSQDNTDEQPSVEEGEDE